MLQRLDFGKRVSFLGPKGTFTHIAAKAYFTDCELEPCSSTADVFQAVLDNRASYGIVPMHNSLSGVSSDAHRALFELPVKVKYTAVTLPLKSCLQVCGDIELNITYNLLVQQGCTEASLKRIYSHHRVLDQCHLFLSERFPDVLIQL